MDGKIIHFSDKHFLNKKNAKNIPENTAEESDKLLQSIYSTLRAGLPAKSRNEKVMEVLLNREFCIYTFSSENINYKLQQKEWRFNLEGNVIDDSAATLCLDFQLYLLDTVKKVELKIDRISIDMESIGQILIADEQIYDESGSVSYPKLIIFDITKKHQLDILSQIVTADKSELVVHGLKNREKVVYHLIFTDEEKAYIKGMIEITSAINATV